MSINDRIAAEPPLASMLPSIDLLKPTPPAIGGPIDKVALDRNARLLETVLSDLGVQGTIVNVRPGPVVTVYELEPAGGVRVGQVADLTGERIRKMQLACGPSTDRDCSPARCFESEIMAQ